MNNPLNELSAVYNQNIAEGCGCDEKKKVKDEMVPQGKTPLGGDGARPGKNKKGYVEPMGESKEEMSDHDKEVAKYREQAKKKTTMPRGDVGHDIHKRAVAQYNKQNPSKPVKEHFSWRDELREVTYGTSSVDKDEVTNTKSKDSDSSRKEIKEKNVKNKIKINPPQGVTEGFKALGGTVVEMYELSEADMTGTPSIKDHKKPKKINVKYDPKMKVMAPTIKSEKFVPPYEPLKTVTDDQRKKRELAQKTKDHDDKMSGKLAEDGMGIEDQMRISREAAAKRKPYQPGDRQKQRAAQVKQMAKNAAKDTRTDAQKMADATGPRPGSRYRGD